MTAAEDREVVGRHFDLNTWTDQPVPWGKGYLATDNYDPTYGNGGLGLGPEVYACDTCGAAVVYPTVHAKWHEESATRIASSPRSSHD